MKIVLIIFIILVFLAVLYCVTNKVHIKFKTFLKPGFKPARGIFGLYCYTGKQGRGKTYSIVEYLQDNKSKNVVFCNIADISGFDYFYFTGFKELILLKQVLDFEYSSYNELFEYCRSLKFSSPRCKDIVTFIQLAKEHKKQIVFVYDEIFTELQKQTKLSKDVIDFLCQMRKRKIIFLTTAQEWAEIPLTFRRFCRYQIDCIMIPIIFTGILIKRFNDAENMKWSDEDQEHVAPLLETTITHTRKEIANSYNTYLRVSSVAMPTASPTRTGDERRES